MAESLNLNLGSADIQNDLPVKDVDMFGFTFFRFLCDENKQDFDCNWDRPTSTLTIKLKEDADEETSTKRYKEAKHIIQVFQCCCKASYTLHGEKMKIAKAFSEDEDLLRQYSDVFVDATVNKGDEIRLVIMASNDHDEMFRNLKHKFEVQIGQKRISKINRTGRRASRRASFRGIQRQSSVLRSSEKKDIFFTFEKVNVIISTDNLENIDGEVDGIVDPTNEKFDPSGQVSQLLRNRGGERYNLACKQILKTHKPSPKECFSTIGGELKSKRVLHAVCPNVQKYSESDIENTVFETVYNCLKHAEKERLQSVAIPFLYTGHGNISVDLCATSYAYAVMEFSRKRQNTFVVNTIYFIDLDETKTVSLVKHFAELLPKSTNQLLELPVLQEDNHSQSKDDIVTSLYVNVDGEKGVGAQIDGFKPDKVNNVDTCEDTLNERKQPDTKVQRLSISESKTDAENQNENENYTKDGYDTIEVEDEQKPDDKDIKATDDSTATKPLNIDDGYEEIDDIDERKNLLTKTKDQDNMKNKLKSELENDKEITKLQVPENDESVDKPYDYVDVQEELDTGESKSQEEHMKQEITVKHDYSNVSEISNKANLLASNPEDPCSYTNLLASNPEDPCPYTCIGEYFSHADTTDRSSQVKSDYVAKKMASHERSFSLPNKISIDVLKGDIREAHVDAIICPEIAYEKYGGLLAVSIKCAFRNTFSPEALKKLVKSKGKRIATTDCRRANATDDTTGGVNFIYHVQTTVYREAHEDEKKLKGSMQLVSRKLKNHRGRKISTVAFPLFGIEDVSKEDRVIDCCKLMAKTIYENCHKYEKDVAPLKIVLINRCGRITEALIKEMQNQVDPPVCL